MNSKVLAFSEPREASHSAVNLRAFGEVNNDGDMVVVAVAIALYPTIVVRAHSANSSSKKTFDWVMCFPLRPCIV
jgi:hypothetical protein